MNTEGNSEQSTHHGRKRASGALGLVALDRKPLSVTVIAILLKNGSAAFVLSRIKFSEHSQTSMQGKYKQPKEKKKKKKPSKTLFF